MILSISVLHPIVGTDVCFKKIVSFLSEIQMSQEILFCPATLSPRQYSVPCVCSGDVQPNEVLYLNIYPMILRW